MGGKEQELVFKKWETQLKEQTALCEYSKPGSKRILELNKPLLVRRIKRNNTRKKKQAKGRASTGEVVSQA